MAMQPTVLEGERVRLEPMAPGHHAGLTAAAMEPEIWRYMRDEIRTADDMSRYMESAADQQRTGTALPFVAIDTRSGQIVGSTRFAAYDPEHRRVEIGWTWLSSAARRTAINTEAKLLMLRHAFEVLGVHRVEFKTDVRNERSRRAILRIGAKQEGVFRKHMLLGNGEHRDSVYFSVIDDESPEVKRRLQAMLRPEHFAAKFQ